MRTQMTYFFQRGAFIPELLMLRLLVVENEALRITGGYYTILWQKYILINEIIMFKICDSKFVWCCPKKQMYP